MLFTVVSNQISVSVLLLKTRLYEPNFASQSLIYTDESCSRLFSGYLCMVVFRHSELNDQPLFTPELQM